MNKTSYNKKLFLIVAVVAIGSIILLSNKVSSGSKRSDSVKSILQKQFLMYPEMKVQDLYKFIHQAAMGSEHAVKDVTSARKWMDEELAIMNTEYQNELYDTLEPGGKLIRVNLRPYRKLGYDTALLVNAFIKTANNFSGSIDTLKYFWSIAIDLADKGDIPLNKSEMKSFIKEKEMQGFPAVHHSELYNKLYNPAYRVVAAEYLDFLHLR